MRVKMNVRSGSFLIKIQSFECFVIYTRKRAFRRLASISKMRRKTLNERRIKIIRWDCKIKRQTLDINQKVVRNVTSNRWFK